MTIPAKEKVRAKAARQRRDPGPMVVSREALLVNGSDSMFRDFVHTLLAVVVRLEEIRAGLAQLVGLTGIQYTILNEVAHLAPVEDVSVKRIAEHLQLSGAFVTIETGKLLEMGLIQKAPDGKDRRRVRLTVSEKGLDLLRELAVVRRQVNDTLFDFLSAREFQQLARVIPKLVDSSDRALSLLRFVNENGRSRARAGLEA